MSGAAGMRLEYFQMIDRVVELTPDESEISAQATVPQSSPIFEGHFPGHPLMPGVLLIETMAQASGFMILVRIGFSRMPLLAAVKEAKLRRFVAPGEVLDVQSRLLHEGSGFSVTEARIHADEKPVCEATLTFRIMPFPDPKVRSELEAVARRTGLIKVPSDAS